MSTKDPFKLPGILLIIITVMFFGALLFLLYVNGTAISTVNSSAGDTDGIAFWSLRYWGGKDAGLAEVIRNIMLSFGIIGAGIGLWLALRRTIVAEKQRDQGQEKQELDRQSHITDQFNKAVEQLGSDKLAIRLGGIYGLWRIGEDSPERDYPRVLNVLCEFIINFNELAYQAIKKETKNTKPEILTIFKLFTKRRKGLIESKSVLELVNSDLSMLKLGFYDFTQANLTGANLMGTNLNVTNLTKANLTEANLTGANLIGANFTDENLTGANLTGAQLIGTNFTGADLSTTNLSGVDLSMSNMPIANLRGLDLSGTNPFQAIMGQLTQKQLDQAWAYKANPPTLNKGYFMNNLRGSKKEKEAAE